MWKNYSYDYLKKNKASSYSIIIGAFIAALFLSFLGSLFYNFWLDNIEGTKQEEGGWHGRITGELGTEELVKISNFANVDKAVVEEESSKENQTVVDIYFKNKRTVYQDMCRIAEALGLSEDVCSYNYQLLSLYFIRIPGDDKPRMLMPAYLAVVALVCVSLILVIHNSFAVSQNSRIHQFGIFTSIGATPGQICTCLLQEAFVLGLLPILLGTFLGVFLSFGTVWAMTAFAANLAGGRQMRFMLHPVIVAAILLLSVFTVLISAWLPARKLSRLTPLEAIRGMGGLELKKKRRFPILSALFGMEGELAGNALRAQGKALRTTSLSLTLAFLGFMLMQCFFALSGISTDHTYFERYQDVWDIMVSVKDTRIEDFRKTEQLKGLKGAQSCVVYQKAQALCCLPREAQSKELYSLGGLEAFAGELSSDEEGNLLVGTTIVILDDKGFEEFCGQIGIPPQLTGSIIWNRFWDSVHSNFRYPVYIPFVEEGMDTVTLQDAGIKARQETGERRSGSMAEIPVIALSQGCPLLREEYEDYLLVQFIPLSLWKEISGQINGVEKKLYIRILADQREMLDDLTMLEEEIVQTLSPEYEIEMENRIQKKLDNDKMIRGFELVLGAFCVLFAVIGVAHVFSNTLGFLYQRKREFARYMSVGVTPKGVRKIFCIEALLMVGRPLLTALLGTIVAVAFMIKASYIKPIEFVRAAPAVPVFVFLLTAFAFVALAYYLGGRRLMKISIADVLKDDSLM
ncbi:MAG: ABC transporter permease [Lachnospiraceae bacterium]|nr:ABC transporter permease [Lachnospiraceae bacterium]